MSVIFLRYKSEELKSIEGSLINLLDKYGSSLYGKFVAVTVEKIRIREI